MEEINLLDYMRILARRKWTVIAVTLVTFALTGIALAIMPRVYEGETVLLFPEQQTDSLPSQLAQLAGLPMLSGVSGLSGRNVYVTVLKSRSISEKVLSRLGLAECGLEYEDLQDHMTLETPKEGGLILRCEVPTSWLRGRVPKSELRERTAQLSADMANAYIAELRTFDRENNLFIGRKQRLYIEDQLKRAESQLAEAEEALKRFQEAHPTLVPPDKSSEYALKGLDLTAKLTESDVALHEMSGQLARARKSWDAGGPENISPEAVIDSPVISELRARLAKLEVERATLLEDFTDVHPDVVKLTQEIDNTNERLRSEINRIIGGQAGSVSPAHQELLKQLVLLEVNYDGLKSRRAALSDAISQLEKKMSGLPADEIQYLRLLRDMKTIETVYTTLRVEHAKALATEGRDIDNFIVLDKAVPDDEPAKPRVLLTLAASLVVGLMLGIAVATSGGPPPTKR